MTVLLEEDPAVAEYSAAVKVLAEMVWASGLPVLDDLHTAAYDWKTDDKTHYFVDLMRNLKPGITQVIVHATERSPNFDVISSSGELRQGDLNAMLDPKLKEAVEEEGIILTSWKEMIERRKQVK